MPDNTPFTKALAVTGTVCIWSPIVIPFLLTVIAFFRRFELVFDFLMPAELFPVAIIGAALLLWASFRARSKRRWISFGIAASALALASAQLLAEVSGMASGAAEASGTWYILAVSLIVVYTVTLAVVGVGGIIPSGAYRLLSTRWDQQTGVIAIRYRVDLGHLRRTLFPLRITPSESGSPILSRKTVTPTGKCRPWTVPILFLTG